MGKNLNRLTAGVGTLAAFVSGVDAKQSEELYLQQEQTRDNVHQVVENGEGLTEAQKQEIIEFSETKLRELFAYHLDEEPEVFINMLQEIARNTFYKDLPSLGAFADNARTVKRIREGGGKDQMEMLLIKFIGRVQRRSIEADNYATAWGGMKEIRLEYFAYLLRQGRLSEEYQPHNNRELREYLERKYPNDVVASYD